MVVAALAVSNEDVRAFSREPLGPGVVAGFEITGEQPVIAYLDTSLLRVARETGPVLEGEARVWIHPADPHLPALAPAAYGHAAEILLGRLGIVAVGMPEIVGYRPGRRAVLRVPTGDGFAWVKVVRPRRIDRVVSAHTLLRAAGLPVPAVRGWSSDGLLVLDEARGTPATEGGWDAGRLLDAVDEMRARIGTAPLETDARTGMFDRLPWYADRLRNALPARAAEVGAITAALTGAPPPIDDRVVIHGDLHLGQIFLDPASGAVTGLIDVDTAGLGHGADDAAAFIAHAMASAVLTGVTRGASRVCELAEAALSRWGDPPTRALVVVQLLGHAVTAAEGGRATAAGQLLDRAAGVFG